MNEPGAPKVSMPIEIERKFLVATDEWRAAIVKSVCLEDGLIASVGGRKVRVRIADDRATLTVKGARVGLGRDEFEYEIPLADAQTMLRDHCEGKVVTKVRHFVQEAGFTFEIDVYDGLLAGIIIAEAELEAEDQDFPRPAWLGEEITGREEYRKVNMLKARLAAAD